MYNIANSTLTLKKNWSIIEFLGITLPVHCSALKLLITNKKKWSEN